MWPVYLHVARLECNCTVSYDIYNGAVRLARNYRGKAVQIGISAERCLLFLDRAQEHLRRKRLSSMLMH